MNFCVCLLLYIYLLKGAYAVILEDIVVPSMVLIDDDDQDDVILDCVYHVENKDNGSLVVKWYKDYKAVYQWIRGQKPAVFPIFREQIDESYAVSDDPNYKHRALSLENLSIDDTGLYKCVVQTIGATHSMEKYLHVIDIRNHTLNLYHHKMENETHLECTVENVYPKPTIHLTTEDDDIIPIITTKLNENELGLFTATSIATVNNENEDDDETFKCIVSFGDLPWNMTTATSFASSVSKTFSKMMFLLVLPVLYMH